MKSWLAQGSSSRAILLLKKAFTRIKGGIMPTLHFVQKGEGNSSSRLTRDVSNLRGETGNSYWKKQWSTLHGLSSEGMHFSTLHLIRLVWLSLTIQDVAGP